MVTLMIVVAVLIMIGVVMFGSKDLRDRVSDAVGGIVGAGAKGTKKGGKMMVTENPMLAAAEEGSKTAGKAVKKTGKAVDETRKFADKGAKGAGKAVKNTGKGAGKTVKETSKSAGNATKGTGKAAGKVGKGAGKASKKSAAFVNPMHDDGGED
jgi:hypothetical protein